MRGRKGEEEGGRYCYAQWVEPFPISSLHRFPPGPPLQWFLIFWGGVTSFRENPMKAMGLLPQNVHIHHTQQQGSTDPWLRSPPLGWGRPASPSPSHHFLTAPDSLEAAAPMLHPCAGSGHSVALPLSRSDPCSGALTWKEWKRYQKAQALMTL